MGTALTLGVFQLCPLRMVDSICVQETQCSLSTHHPEHTGTATPFTPGSTQAADSKKGGRSEATLRWEVISLQHLSVMSFTSSVRGNRAGRFWH